MADESQPARQRGSGIGPTGKQAAANLKQLRDKLSLRDLESKLTDNGRKISASGLQKTEAEDRKVDLDELMALAVALNVSPLELILPPSTDEPALITGIKHEIPASDIWGWALGRGSLDADLDADERHDKKVLKLNRALRDAEKAVIKEERRLSELREERTELARQIQGLASVTGVLGGNRTKWDIDREIETCRDDLADAELRRNDAKASLERLRARGPKWQR